MDNTKKMIEIKHHKDDYECMWNGIEDFYIWTKRAKFYLRTYSFCFPGSAPFVI